MFERRVRSGSPFAKTTMKYLVLLTVVSFACVCALVASADLDDLKRDLKIADWTSHEDADEADDFPVSDSDIDPALASGGPQLVLMKFGAHWCPPCRMIDKELKVLGQSDVPVEIRKVDVDKRQDLARKYGVTSIPRLILLEDGREVGDLTGYRSAEELTDWIKDSASSAALAGKKRSAGPSVVHANPFFQ